MSKQPPMRRDTRSDATYQSLEHPVLAVSCVDALPDEFREAVRPYELSTNSLDGRLRMEKAHYACVIAIVDPTSKPSMKSLEALQTCANRFATPLVSCSPVNPSWIENLMQHLGVVAHFKEPPNAQQIKQVVEVWKSNSSSVLNSGSNS